MWKETIRIKLKCPKHPRYTPRRGGLGAVKGGCDMCGAMALAQDALEQTELRLDHAEELIDDYKNRRSNS
jgi:hypothetical protein